MKDWFARQFFRWFVCWWRGCRLPWESTYCLDCGRRAL